MVFNAVEINNNVFTEGIIFPDSILEIVDLLTPIIWANSLESIGGDDRCLAVLIRSAKAILIAFILSIIQFYSKKGEDGCVLLLFGSHNKCTYEEIYGN